MTTLNKVTLIGYLGHAPELRYMASGDAVAHLSLATTETWKDKATGERKEATEWHRVVLYRKLAETAAHYLQKGSQIYLEGRLQTRKWTGKDDIDRYTTEIIADDMRMLGARPHADHAEDDAHHAEDEAPVAASSKGRSRPLQLDDAIPF